jgi:GNAT superfamily N-acetyltransferase
LVWERVHRHRRQTRPPAAPDFTPAASHSQPSGAQARAAQPLSPSIRVVAAPVSVDDYLALVRRVEPGSYDAGRAAAALEQTINIGAWDGDQFIGVARVLSDGYFFAALADVIVDPDYQRRGVGRELMNRAYEKTPRGALSVGAVQGTAAFFDRIGCERGPSGFTMRRAAKT